MSETFSEFCPLSSETVGAMLRDIPDICSSQCQGLIGGSASKPPRAHDIDVYDDELHRDECANPDYSEIQFSHDAIHKGPGPDRNYTIVNECAECSTELYEESFNFNCPYDGIDPVAELIDHAWQLYLNDEAATTANFVEKAIDEIEGAEIPLSVGGLWAVMNTGYGSPHEASLAYNELSRPVKQKLATSLEGKLLDWYMKTPSASEY